MKAAPSDTDAYRFFVKTCLLSLYPIMTLKRSNHYDLEVKMGQKYQP